MSADLTARLAALLGEHWTAGMAANGAARKWECACGERIAMSDAAHRAHVAAVLAEAGVGFVAEAAGPVPHLPGLFEMFGDYLREERHPGRSAPRD